MRIIILCLLLSGCYNSRITAKNAESECFLYNVACKGLKVRTDGIEPEVQIVGANIGLYCPRGSTACYHPSTYRIYSDNNDGMKINHEKMHHYFNVIGHNHERRKLTPLVKTFKDS
jgi:hypothetical protein